MTTGPFPDDGPPENPFPDEDGEPARTEWLDLLLPHQALPPAATSEELFLHTFQATAAEGDAHLLTGLPWDTDPPGHTDDSALSDHTDDSAPPGHELEIGDAASDTTDAAHDPWHAWHGTQEPPDSSTHDLLPDPTGHSEPPWHPDPTWHPDTDPPSHGVEHW